MFAHLMDGLFQLFVCLLTRVTQKVVEIFGKVGLRIWCDQHSDLDPGLLFLLCLIAVMLNIHPVKKTVEPDHHHKSTYFWI